MKIATISSKGQITIPRDMQKSLNVTYGSKVMVYSDKDTLVIKPMRKSITEQTAGSLAHLVPLEKRGIPWSTVIKETQRLAAKELVEGK